MCQDIKGESMDVERLEIVLLCGLDRGKRLDRVVGRNRQDEPTRSAIERVARASDSLDQRRDLPRGIVLDDPVNRASVGAKLEGQGPDQGFELAPLETH